MLIGINKLFLIEWRIKECTKFSPDERLVFYM